MATREEMLGQFRELYTKHDHLGALGICRSILELNPRDALGWRNMGACYQALGQMDDAAEMFRRGLDIDPKDAYGYCYLGVLSSRKGDHQGALDLYQKALDLNANLTDAALGMASSHYQMGDLPNALYYYTQAYQNNQDNPDVARSFGVTLMRVGQLSQAVFYLKQAIEHRPDWAEAHMELGEALRLLGEDRDAVTELLKGLRIKMKPEGLVSLGRIHLKYNEPRKALAHLHQALKLGPNNAPAHHALGRCYMALKEWPEAIKHCEEAYKWDPDSLESALDLAASLVEGAGPGSLDRAYRLASAVRVKDPNQVRAFDILGWCLFKQGRHPEAFENLEKARTLIELREVREKADAPIYEHLAAVYDAMKDSMMSREMYSRALESDPSRRAEWQKRSQEVGGNNGPA
jgi:tetratricopeptide (TPR) repeat protein